jgi:hypothetical protein
VLEIHQQGLTRRLLLKVYLELAENAVALLFYPERKLQRTGLLRIWLLVFIHKEVFFVLAELRSVYFNISLL